MMFPAVPPLEKEMQAEVDRAWENMLTPADRLDRQMLLDVLMENGLHVMGCDRLTMRSEKLVAGGLVVMVVEYERGRVDGGSFAFVYRDNEGRVLRSERYTGKEILERVKKLGEERADGVVAEAHEERRRAATRPVGR